MFRLVSEGDGKQRISGGLGLLQSMMGMRKLEDRAQEVELTAGRAAEIPRPVPGTRILRLVE